MKRCLIFLLSLVFFVSAMRATSQEISVRESTVLVPDFLHVFFPLDHERYLALDYSGPHGLFSSKREDQTTTATIYDKNLRQVSSSPIKGLAGMKYETGIRIKGRIQLFYTDSHQDVYRCELDSMGKDIREAPQRLFTIRGERTSFSVGCSPDSAYAYLFYFGRDKRGKAEDHSGVIFDRDMHVSATFSFSLKDVKEYIASSVCAMSPNGALYIISAVRAKATKADYRPLQYVIRAIDKDGKATDGNLNDMPEGLVDNIAWSADEKGLSFVGLMAKTKKSGFTTVLSGNYSIVGNKLSAVRQVDLSVKDGLPPETNLLRSYTFADGSVLMILQQSEVTSTTRGDFSYVDTHTGNLYAIKLDPTKTPEWIQIIPNLQTEPTYPIFSGTISMSDGSGGVYLFYHDDQRNEKLDAGGKASQAILGAAWRFVHLAAVHITANGTVTKKYIVDDTVPDLLLAPAKSFFVAGNDLIYTSYNLKSIGKSTYRIGRIRIEGHN